MANKKHLKILRKGVEKWNSWKRKNPNLYPDLKQANLCNLNLNGIDFSYTDLNYAVINHSYLRRANLIAANLKGANLCMSDLQGADLRTAFVDGTQFAIADLSNVDFRGTDLGRANLQMAKLCGANLERASFNGIPSLINTNFRGSNFRETSLMYIDMSGSDLGDCDFTFASFYNVNLQGAKLVAANLNHTIFMDVNLMSADLSAAILVKTTFTRTDLTSCIIYGISAWDIKIEESIQKDLIITDKDSSSITVDNLEVAHYIYLLLHNEKIRRVIDTVSEKVVLILGRFTPERKNVLETIKRELRNRDYVPILFDFKKPKSRDLTETISTLAHLSRFIIADITDARSVPQELQAIVPNLPSVIVQPILHISDSEYGMFAHIKRYPWVLPLQKYEGTDKLNTNFVKQIIEAAEQKVKQLQNSV